MGKTSKILIMAFLTISCILLLGCEKTKPRIALSDFSEEQKELLQGTIDTDFKAFKIIGSLEEYDDIEVSLCVYERGKLIGEDNMVGMSLNKEDTLKYISMSLYQYSDKYSDKGELKIAIIGDHFNNSAKFNIDFNNKPNEVGKFYNNEVKIEKGVEYILFAQLERNQGSGRMSFIFDGKDEVDRAIENYDRVVLLKCKFK
ncbi:hypothetical protein [Clostridium sp. UBA6640]|uniref:hypothetical protein n=1 Tax=Clostridium sp. UBA6640 TaxID=1946370 RepID=UPI0025C0A493|nr:hypothetical protein [Clostridium sp. UBA6640]